MSDFSMFSLFAAGLACLAPLTAAYTQPKGDKPSGNPIAQPGLNSVVPAGKPFTVEWQPTTQGTVTLVLLKGPATNAVPQYPLVENYDNTGTFVWTPSTDLVPTTDAEGYGIQLIVDATGEYQYTTQFGISNADYKAGSSSSASSSWAASSSSCTDSSSSAMTAPASSTKKTVWAPIVTGYTTICPNSTFAVVPTGGAKPGNVTAIPAPYTAPSAPSSAAPPATYGSATASGPSTKYTGAASSLSTSLAGLVLAAGAAVFAL